MINRQKLPQDFQGNNKKTDLFQQMAKLSGERLRDLRGSPKSLKQTLREPQLTLTIKRKMSKLQLPTKS